MRSFIALVALVSCVAAQNAGQQQYVFDILRPQLDAGSVVDLLLNAQPGVTYPNYADIPNTNFACSAQPGFYADVNAQCQVFHRCDINGNITSYLCANTTLFNQITLVCDYFWNVDCPGQQQYANFANSRLYTDQPLFDTPPADYVAPSQLLAQQQQEQLNGQAAAGAQAGQHQGQQAQGSRTQAQGTRTQTQTQGARVQNQAGRTQQNINQGRLNVVNTQSGNRFAGRAGAVAGANQNQVGGGAFVQGGNVQGQQAANANSNLNTQQGVAAAVNANLNTNANTQQQQGATQDVQGATAPQGAAEETGAATEDNTAAAGTGAALNVAVQGVNGQVSQSQVNPGQSATLQAGNTAITAANTNGNAQLTAQ